MDYTFFTISDQPMIHPLDLLVNDQKSIFGSEAASAPNVEESPVAESAPDIAGWIFRVLIVIGLALVVYTTFTGRLFNPSFRPPRRLIGPS